MYCNIYALRLLLYVNNTLMFVNAQALIISFLRDIEFHKTNTLLYVLSTRISLYFRLRVLVSIILDVVICLRLMLLLTEDVWYCTYR